MVILEFVINMPTVLQGKLAILSATNCFISVDDESCDVVALVKKASDSEMVKVCMVCFSFLANLILPLETFFLN